MHEVVSQAVVRARAGQGPSLIEGRTYRYFDHSLGLGRIVRAAYRPKYDRLVAVKDKYDPTNLFRLNQNIKPTV